MKLSDYGSSINIHEAFEPYQGAADIERLYRLLAQEESSQSFLAQKNISGISKRDLIRAFLTIRPAGNVSEELANLNDALLQEELKHITITDSATIASFPYAGRKVSVWKGDITRLKVDAIVNAANNQMLGCFIPFHTCIDNVIHDAAGVQLRRDCGVIMDLQGKLEATGIAKITRGYNLPSSFVIHTVGPIVQGALTESDKALLASSYFACLDQAEEMQLFSIAICAISTGVFGFPKEAAVDVAKAAIQNWLKLHPKSSVQHIIMNAFDEDTYRLYEDVWA